MALVSQILLVVSLTLLMALGSLLSPRPLRLPSVEQVGVFNVTVAQTVHAASPVANPQISHRWPNNQADLATTKHYEGLVYQVLGQLPVAQAQAVRQITITYDIGQPRGLGGGDRIIINAVGVPDEEFVAVLVHELGHIVDTGLLSGNHAAGVSPFQDGPQAIYQDDHSVAFYALSWQSETVKNLAADSLDFVSGYAQADAFEDFAESYTYYLLHGRDFRALASTNGVLYQKYAFLKNQVFAGQEYETGTLAGFDATKRSYDATLIPWAAASPLLTAK